MKKRSIIIFSILIPILLIGGIIGGVKLNEQQTKERQITFLKAHETKLTTAVKVQSYEVKTVSYDWNSVQTGTVGNGTPQGGGTILYLTGFVNGKKDNEVDFYFTIENNGFPNLSSFEITNLVIEGKNYE